MNTTKTKNIRVRRVTPEVRAAIINMWLTGDFNGNQIGAAVGHTHATVFNVLERAGIRERVRLPQKAPKNPANAYTAKPAPKAIAPVLRGESPVVPMPITMIEPKKLGFWARIWAAIRG